MLPLVALGEAVTKGDIEDVCQEVFVALWKSAASYDPARGDEATFAAMIARRRVVDRQRTDGGLTISSGCRPPIALMPSDDRGGRAARSGPGAPNGSAL